MTADMLHHHLDLTSANNLLTIHHHHNHQHGGGAHGQHSRGRASSVTSDQYSSLNLSSVGSSASSAHHSPIMEHFEDDHFATDDHHVAADHAQRHRQAQVRQAQHRHTTLEGHFSHALRLSLPSSVASGRDSQLGGASSDYTGSQASIPPLSPASALESPLSESANLLSLGSSAAASPLPAGAGSPPTSDHRQQLTASPRSPSKSHPHHARHLLAHSQSDTSRHLHPNDYQQRGQKARSFSHSTSHESSLRQGSDDDDRSRAPATPGGDAENRQQQQQVGGGGIVERPRRLSRIENRQSLHDLGYGQTESYFKLSRLGKGTYATVYMGRSRVNNDLVALKEILKEHDEGAPCTAIREVSLLRLLRHNNIVTLHDVCHTPKKLTLVFEYVGPDLYAYMKENNHLLSIHNVRLLLFQLLRGIAFCHSRQVLHRDLKPQNLLINTSGELKICDFGLARAKSIPTKSYSNEVVTLWYRPPDVLLGNTDYDHSIDMWGVGCIFYEMASGRTFFPGSSVRQQLYLIFSSLGAPNVNNWPEVLANPEYLSYSFPSFRPEKLAHRVPRLDATGLNLLQSFLRFKPSERLSAHEAMRDPFFACLPPQVHKLHARESIFDVPGVYMAPNPGQKFQNQNYHHHHQQQQQQQQQQYQNQQLQQQQQQQPNQQYFHSH